MSSIVVDYAYTIAYELVRIAVPLATAPYIARVLGAEGTGAHAYTHSIANYFLLFALLGVKTHGNRSVAALQNRRERSRVFSHIYCAQAGMAFVCVLLYIGFARFVAKPELSNLFYLDILYVGSAFVDIDWFFFGIQQFKRIAIRTVAIKVLSAVPIFLFVRSMADLPVYTAIVSGSFFASPLLLFIMARSELTFVRPSLSGVLKHLKSMLLLFMPVIVVSLYRIMDKIMLGGMAGMAELGYYENAEKIISAANGVIVALGTVMLPRMSRLAAQGNTATSETHIANSMELAMLVASALSFGFIAVAPHLVVVFFGKDFAACAPLLAGLAATIPMLAFGNVIRTHYFIPNQNDAPYIVSAFLGALLNMGLNALLIPLHGARGAVAATVITEFAVVLYQWIAARHVVKWNHLRNCAFSLGAGAAMYVLVRCLASRMQPTVKALLMEIFAGGILYILFSAVHICVSKRSFFQHSILAFAHPAFKNERKKSQ